DLVDWDALRDPLRPAHIDPQAWVPIFTNLTRQLGTTWGDYVRTLNDDAAYLGRLGQRVVDAADLFAFEFQQAVALHTVGTVSDSGDAAVETPGLELVFRRFATNSILGRYELGGFGRGWHAPWEERLVFEGNTTLDRSVSITGPAGARRRFPYYDA